MLSNHVSNGQDNADLSKWSPGTIFQQDNARSHTAKLLKTSSFSDSSMAGPLPDLSPVEHMAMDQLKRQMPSCHSGHMILGEVAVQNLWAICLRTTQGV
ncbi:hypothetical protein TNCV_4645261 [Trichonephila clavipes]|nr:hypothetical protein TNCV_4645261 [Trichonephila clavipes]